MGLPLCASPICRTKAVARFELKVILLAVGTLFPVCWRSLEFRGLSANPTQSNSINRIQSIQSIHSNRIQPNQIQYNSNHIILNQCSTFQQSQSNQSNPSILAYAFSLRALKCNQSQVSCMSTLLTHWCSQFIGCPITVAFGTLKTPCSARFPGRLRLCGELTAMLLTVAMSTMAYTWS